MKTFEITSNGFKDQRFQLAIQLLCDGGGFIYSGIGFFIVQKKYLEIRIESSWHPERITPSTAENDFLRAEAILDEI